jgi:hypothetical protein
MECGHKLAKPAELENEYNLSLDLFLSTCGVSGHQILNPGFPVCCKDPLRKIMVQELDLV